MIQRLTEKFSLAARAQSDLDYDDGFGITIVLEESRPMDEIYSWLQTGIMQDIAGTNSAHPNVDVLFHLFVAPCEGLWRRFQTAKEAPAWQMMHSSASLGDLTVSRHHS
jgi:hypothetical protein